MLKPGPGPGWRWGVAVHCVSCGSWASGTHVGQFSRAGKGRMGRTGSGNGSGGTGLGEQTQVPAARLL